MARYMMIMNPQADNGHVGDMDTPIHRAVEQQLHSLREQGITHEMTWQVTQFPRHATDLARQAADDNIDVVVAIGGDGTVHEIVNGLMATPREKRPRLAILPVGSGNDFAANLGLPVDLESAVRVAFSGVVRQVDAMVVADGTGRREYWNNTLGFGFSGIVNRRTRALSVRGFLKYLVAVLQTIAFDLPRIGVQITTDDQETIDTRVAMVSVCNGPREGGGFPVAPNAALDDGLITFMVMRELSRLRLLYFVQVVMNANHLKYTKIFSEHTAHHVTIRADQPVEIHIDGEIFAAPDSTVQEISVEVLPGALTVIV